MRKPKGVPRDEWLLAIGLANEPDVTEDEAFRMALAIDPHGSWIRGDGNDQSAAFEGACDAVSLSGIGNGTDEGNPDAYAAGAGLAMALEGS